MDRGAWRAIVHGLQRVRHDLTTTLPTQRVQDRSPVRELKSHMPHSQEPKHKTEILL